MLDESVASIEAKLRSVLAELFNRSLGSSWQQFLPRRVAKELARQRRAASEARPGVPEDPWRAAGLSEIRSVVVHFLRELHERRGDFSSTDPDGLLPASLCELWQSAAECEVDIGRLQGVRHDQAHPGVTAPLGAVVESEMAAAMKRLRLGCEAIQRRLTDRDGEWWPYIEKVTCPGIDGWLFERKVSPNQSGNVLLVEGDQLEFIVQAVNPTGPDDDLEYGVSVQGDGGCFSPLEWKDEPRLFLQAAPPGRHVSFLVAVRASGGGHSANGTDDEVIFPARIAPALMGSTTTN